MAIILSPSQVGIEIEHQQPVGYVSKHPEANGFHHGSRLKKMAIPIFSHQVTGVSIMSITKAMW